MYDRKAFKREAKQLMRASTPHFMLVALVYVLLTTGLNYVVAWLTSDDGLLAGTLSVFLNILTALFTIVMGVGFVNYALRLSRREPTSMNSLFAAFSFSGRAIGVRLLVALFSILWSLPVIFVFVFVVEMLLVFSSSIPIVIGAAVVLYIAVLALLIAITLRYAMATTALADDPEAGVMTAIRRSIQMMRGYKDKFFVLGLSFIGWELLIGLIMGVVMGFGFMVSGADWIFQTFMAAENDPFVMYSIVEKLMDQMAIWNLLADAVCLPLSLWLAVYRQTAFARFYNYVCGYDYHQYMNTRQDSDPEAPGQEPRKPDQPPPGGYYTSIFPPQPHGEGPEASDDQEEI